MMKSSKKLIKKEPSPGKMFYRHKNLPKSNSMNARVVAARNFASSAHIKGTVKICHRAK
jgi:hypothetical protein